jgi:hypothetical protein
MEPPIKTRKQILEELNSGGSNNWVESEGLFSFISIQVRDDKKVLARTESVVVVKLFANNKTGEIKSYLAKELDVPERESL